MSVINNDTGKEMTLDDIQAQLAEHGLAVPEDVVEESHEEAKAESEEISTEDEAKSKGWKPDGRESAEEYLRSKPLYEEIKSRGKELKELRAVIDEMKAHMDKQKEVGYQEALKELQAQRLNAISRGDAYGVDAAEQAIEHHKAEISKPAPVQEFLIQNASWINEQSSEAEDMRMFAHAMDQSLTVKSLSPADHIKKVEDALKARFPHRFGEVAPVPVSSVESALGRDTPKRGKKFKFADLSTEQKECARHFERHNIMPVEKYIESLIAAGDLK